MALVNGIVERINNANRGGRKVFSVLVDGQWYGGFWNDAPNCGEGDHVEFDATQNGNFWNANPNTLRRVSAAQTAAPAATTAGTGNSVASSPAGGNRQESIVYQSSRKDAIELVGILLQNDILTLPTKKADKMAAVLDIVAELTDDFAYTALNPEIISPDERLQRDVMSDANEGVDD